MCRDNARHIIAGAAPMNHTDTAWPSKLLDRMQYEADPLADRTIAAILGPWQNVHAQATPSELLDGNADRWRLLAAVSRVFDDWKDNASLRRWTPRPDTPPEVARAVADYLRDAPGLPPWADTAKIDRAETLFMDFGVLSCLLLFCSSLPECYVIPDLSQALLRDRAARAAHRIPHPRHGRDDLPGDDARRPHETRGRWRRAGAEGAADPRDDPPSDPARRARRGAAQWSVTAARCPTVSCCRRSARCEAPLTMHHALFAHGWNVGKDGLPCNQEELAYTLLTFHFVFLRGLRKLGLGLRREDEEAYLHAWNVIGHVLGIRRELMAHTMEEAEALFERIQARGRADPFTPDPRPEARRRADADDGAPDSAARGQAGAQAADSPSVRPHDGDATSASMARCRGSRRRCSAWRSRSCGRSTTRCGWSCATSRSRASSRG